MVKNQGTKQRGQRILGDCWQWEANGQCVKGDNCSFRHDIDSLRILSCGRMSEHYRGPEVPEARVPVVQCLDGLARILRKTCNNSFFEKWHPPECLYYKTKSGCLFGEKCSFAHRQVDEQSTKMSQTNDDTSAVAILKGNWQERESVADGCHDRPGKPGKRRDEKLGQNSSKRQFCNARQLGCVFQDMKPPKSILRKGTDMSNV